jgi:hypothetical protein
MATSNPNNPASAIPSWNPILPVSKDAFQSKTKQFATLEIPGCFYNQWVPTAATVTSGTVTNNGQSLIAGLQLGGATATTAPLGGDAVVTFSSNSGLLCTIATSDFMPTTLNYDQYPVTFTTTSGTLPTGITANTLYYWQWVSATTGRLALTPGGTAIAYTNAGSGTIYCQAASASIGYGYYGSPWLPAGFLQASEGMGTLNYSTSSAFPGCSIHVDIMGHKIGTGTNNFAVTPGLYSTAGTWTALTATGSALAAVNAGPFPFINSTDIIIQQYGPATATTAYTAACMIRCVNVLSVYSAAGTHTEAVNIFTKTTSLDLTQQYAVDVRYLAATPVIGEYMEPLFVRMIAYN